MDFIVFNSWRPTPFQNPLMILAEYAYRDLNKADLQPSSKNPRKHLVPNFANW
jgi:hypothetical protein